MGFGSIGVLGFDKRRSGDGDVRHFKNSFENSITSCKHCLSRWPLVLETVDVGIGASPNFESGDRAGECSCQHMPAGDRCSPRGCWINNMERNDMK